MDKTLAPPRSLGEKVYEYLRADILTMTIKPGQPLIEGDLAKAFSTSRTPVREALGRLEVEGLVVSHHGRGAQVSDVSIRDLLEAFEVRELLEPRAARLAAANINEQQAKRMRMMLDAIQQDPSNGENLAERIQFDLEMHNLILDATGNYTLRSVVRDMHMRTQRTYPLLQRYEETANEHFLILEAILAGDQDAAEERMAEHIRGLKKRLIL